MNRTQQSEPNILQLIGSTCNPKPFCLAPRYRSFSGFEDIWNRQLECQKTVLLKQAS